MSDSNDKTTEIDGKKITEKFNLSIHKTNFQNKNNFVKNYYGMSNEKFVLNLLNSYTNFNN
jgi:hypothetical protein